MKGGLFSGSFDTRLVFCDDVSQVVIVVYCVYWGSNFDKTYKKQSILLLGHFKYLAGQVS